VRKAGDRVRITGQLVDAATGAHLWADHFDGPLQDVFELQDRVTATVAGTIEPRLQRAEVERVRLKPAADMDAYDYFLRGMASFHLVTPAGYDAALVQFTKAFEHDPNYGAAFAMAAHCVAGQKVTRGLTGAEVARALHWARQAAAFGRDDAMALYTAGFVLAYIGNEMESGATLLDRACMLNPNLAAAWNFAGYVQLFLGQPDRAIASFEQAVRLSPLDPILYQFHTGIAHAHLFAGRYMDAVIWAERATMQQSNWSPAWRALIAAYEMAGRHEDARRAVALVREAFPSLRLSNIGATMPAYRRPQDTAVFIDTLRRAGLPE
jgi:tetratricopeptide (TPR) repeat protein